MQSTELTPAQWTIADAIARTLVRDNVKVNELQKAIAYLRMYGDREKAGIEFFNYLQILAREGKQVGHSQQTQRYYDTIKTTCRQYLHPYSEDIPTLLHILGWASRLVRYYADGVPTGEIAVPTVLSEREAEIQAAIATAEAALGDEVAAIVRVIKGNQVTYEIPATAQKLKQKEPKKAASLIENQEVEVEIMELYEDGRIKRVKLI